MKAYAYIRCSGTSQIEGDSFPRQCEAIKRYAQANDYNCCVYCEDAVSGKMEGMDRPAWFEMLTAIKRDGIKTIIIERLDRLARALLIQEHIIADLQHQGITIISTMEPDLDSTDPTRVLMRQILGAFAEYDRAMIVLKLRGARQRKKLATGRCEGPLPFGHKPEEAPILQRIMSMRKLGLRYTAIARELNSSGMRPRRSALWDDGTVRLICLREEGVKV